MTGSRTVFAAQSVGFIAACASMSFLMVPSTALPASHPTAFGSKKLPATYEDTSGGADQTTFPADYSTPDMMPGFAPGSDGYDSGGGDLRAVSEDADGNRGRRPAPEVDPEMRRLNAEMAALDREVAETTRTSMLAAEAATQPQDPAPNDVERQQATPQSEPAGTIASAASPQP